MADVRSLRVEEVADATRKKKMAQTKEDGKHKPKTDRPSVRKNQAEERREQLNQAIKRASFSSADMQYNEKVAECIFDNPTKTQSITEAPAHQSANRLAGAIQAKLNKFHDRRGTV